MYVPEENSFFVSDSKHNRFAFPEGIVRVNGGQGGDALLILGSEKTVLYDCGMACFYDKTLSNIHEVLDPLGRRIDVIIMSHTHYDHIGALPYILGDYPEAVVMGSAFCEKVFNSETAIKTMEELGDGARKLYNVPDSIKVSARGMRLDHALSDGEAIELGSIGNVESAKSSLPTGTFGLAGERIIAYETPGHTMCSMAYGIVKNGENAVLLFNETCGTYDGLGKIEPSPLKSYEMTCVQAKRLKALGYKTLIGLHYGVVDPETTPVYFDKYIDCANEEHELFVEAINEGLNDEEIFALHMKHYWTEERRLNQPFGAYSTNTHILIKLVRKELAH